LQLPDDEELVRLESIHRRRVGQGNGQRTYRAAQAEANGAESARGQDALGDLGAAEELSRQFRRSYSEENCSANED
jgi:hypothetical protein